MAQARLEEWLTPSEIVNNYTNFAPVDLDALANALGIDVISDDFMSDDVSGRIERTPGEFRDYRITLNGRHHPNRRRFTLAHEIGHFILHRDMIGDGIFDDAMYRSSLADRYERQANRYAAELLMPASLVRRYIQEHNPAPGQLARHFQVSKAAAEIRLAEIGVKELF
ncbi:ImmA/IrrE family metallo-endopeptidase [Rhodospirillum rubrum]|uniref:ImmA/IrrE family metallo-endopeptidase n=1 Tax=Rhodospirillum rubrum TaxID=1085 RepID=UPI0019081926|nr:ImmA/IrrE family metallo-endopeptidase [Rhodospirillum rubrum]